MSLAANPIGCENYNSTMFKCWNQNPSHNSVTCFTKDGTQMANVQDTEGVIDPDNFSCADAVFSWVEYEPGVFYIDDSNNLNRFPFVMNPATATYETDNLTYWKVDWKGKLKQGARTLYYYHSKNQSLHDEYVNLSFQARMTGMEFFPYNISMYWLMKNIDIWNDGIVDYYNLNNGSFLGYALNSTTRERYYNISPWLTLTANPAEAAYGAIQWRFGEGYDAIIEPTGSVNNMVAFYKSATPPYPSTRIYTIEQQWIDIDPCIVTCSTGFSVSLSCTANFSYATPAVMNQTESLYFGCAASVSGKGLLGTCLLSECAAFSAYNTTGGFPNTALFAPIPPQDLQAQVNCKTAGGGDCWKDIDGTYGAGLVYAWSPLVYGVKPGDSRHTGGIKAKGGNASGTRPGWNYVTTIKPLRVYENLTVNVTLTSPDNNTIINTSWAVLNCSVPEGLSQNGIFGYSWLERINLYINETYNTTQTSSQYFANTWMINASFNITGFSTQSNYTWTCEACVYNTCVNATNGINMFEWMHILDIVYGRAIFSYFFIDRPSSFKAL